jgi:signal transduction histidine kinase
MAATSSLLANPDQSRESQHELLEIADQEARRLRELIDDTVEVGRLDSAKIEVDAEPANVADIVREVIAAMNADGDARAIQAEYDEAPAAIAPVIAIDRRLVKLAVKQLLDNAFKYSPATEPIQVRVHNRSGMVTVEVTDHGPGIAAQEQSRIFDRLYRSPSVERQIPGSGLGLSIAQNIAHAHHGDVTVTSRPGETTFRLTLAANTEGKRS